MNLLARLSRAAIAYHRIHQLTGIDYWRHLIFTGVFAIGVFAVFPAYIAGQIVAVQLGLWEVFAANTGLYALALTLLLRRRLAHRIRFALGAHLFFALGTILSLLRGPVSAGPLWLFAFPIVGGILLGRRFALYALSLNAIVLSLVAFGIHFGPVRSWVEADISSKYWLVYSLNHLCIASAVAISAILLVEGLEKNIGQVEQMARSLAASNQELKAQIAAYGEVNSERQVMTQALDKSPIATLIFREDGTLRYCNRSATAVFALPERAVERLPLNLDSLWHSDCESAIAIAKQRGQAECELTLQPPGSAPIFLDIHLHYFEYDRETLFCAFAIDITHRKQAERQLQHLAYHDHLTGLPNRALYLEAIDRALTRAQCDRHYQFALLFVDLDKFKTVNDSLGHLAGDVLLQQVGYKLADSVGELGLVSRFGGDEFALLLENYRDRREVWDTIATIFSRLQDPLTYEHHQISFTASIGIVWGVDIQSTTPELLLRDADIAMYQAKFSGGNQAVVLDTAIREQFTHRFELESDLNRAIASHEFALVYQPIVDLATHQIVGFEALLRWHHPQRGQLKPKDFIPLAEECGAIVPLGAWLLEQACAQLSHWRSLLSPDRDLRLNLNLSAVQFNHPGLLASIQSALERYQLPPEALVLEITESVMMANAETTVEILQQLSASGIGVAMDDFGTGYSSLACLQDFPIDTIKIDKAFIRPLLQRPENVALVQAILTLASALHCKAIAEGVETTASARQLRELGCPFGQGWLYGQPLSAEQLEPLIRQRQPAEF